MSEYVILWQSHRKGEHGIALANSFGGITQVMFMVLPFTLIAIGSYQALINPNHPELPLPFSFNNMLLLMCLFPMFFVLIELLEEDHTLGLLDTTIMVTIFLLLIVLLLSYGATT
jgi:Ca2+/Na+ antiporter